MSSSIVTPKQLNEDRSLDLTLRPRSFEEYMGQQKIKDNLKILIEAAQKRGEPIEHVLLYGPSGLGKTSLAHIIAREMKVNIKVTSGPAIEKVGDLASILTNLQPGDILFCDECHRLNKTIEETLYPAMEAFVLDIVIGKGPSARTLQLELPRFTFIGATTRTGLISSPLRSRFGATYRLDFYEQPDIEKIIARSAEILKVKIDQAEALKIIAQCARRTPRVANRLLKRVRDYSQVKANGVINKEIAQEALRMLEIDHCGLEPTDRRLLEIIIKKFNGGPVGLQTLAAAANEEVETIADVYEPYLLQSGFLVRTPRGRIATKLAYDHLGLKYEPKEQNRLF
jgi:Holliday junction DNA helicase RuvB